MVRQLPRDDWREDRAEIWLCTFPLRPAAFADRTGIVLEREVDQLGETDIAVASLDGDVVLFQARPPNAGPPETEFVSSAARGDVRNLAHLLEKLCQLARVEQSNLKWVQSDLSPRSWGLFRLDDNGNRFLMSLFRDRSIAEQMAIAYERRGHKQTYVVESAL